MSTNTKKLPVTFRHVFSGWHPLFGGDDAVFQLAKGGYPSVPALLDGIAAFNAQRIALGQSIAGVALHACNEVALFTEADSPHAALAEQVNLTGRAAPWGEVDAWFDANDRPDRPFLADFPVAAFGSTLWGKGGSIASDDESARQAAWACWSEAARIVKSARSKPWGESAFLLLWDGGNGDNIFAANPEEQVRLSTYVDSARWQREEDALVRILTELDEDVHVEPKLCHPTWMVNATTRIAAIMAKKVNVRAEAAGSKRRMRVLLEVAHVWIEGGSLDVDLAYLIEEGLLVNSRGFGKLHGNAGFKLPINVAHAIENVGIIRGDIPVLNDIDYPWAHCSPLLREEQRRALRVLIERAGVVNADAPFETVTIDVTWDVRSQGRQDSLQPQIQSIVDFDADVERVRAQIG